MSAIAGVLVDPRQCGQTGLTAIDELIESQTSSGAEHIRCWRGESSVFALDCQYLSSTDHKDREIRPLASQDESLVMAFAGELFNALKLRTELESLGYLFEGTGSAEIALAAAEHFGIEVALSRFTGEFSIALWNARQRVLYLARDRTGARPLYAALGDGMLLFASELKTLGAFPASLTDDLVPGVGTNMCTNLNFEHSGRRLAAVFELRPGSLVAVQLPAISELPVTRESRPVRTWWSLLVPVSRALGLRLAFAPTNEGFIQ